MASMNVENVTGQAQGMKDNFTSIQIFCQFFKCNIFRQYCHLLITLNFHYEFVLWKINETLIGLDQFSQFFVQLFQGLVNID